MHSYNPADWQSFFIAVTGAAAALTGLLFVAVSINLGNILKDTPEGTSMLPARAAETLAALLFIVIGSALTLVPQNIRLLGLEILVIVVPLLAVSAAATVPGTLAGLSLAVHWGGGFYWLVPAALLGIAGAVYGAWVLLVEIVR